MVAYSTINLNDLRVVRENEQMIIAYCPFHNDKSRPNLQVDKTGPYAGRFICWACGAKGAVKGLHIEHKEPRVAVSVEWEMLSHIYRTHLTKAALSRLMDYWSLRHKETLFRMAVGWTGQAWSFPLYNDLFKIIGIQRIYPEGHKRTVRGSKMGLLLPAQICWYRPIIVCEGVSDTATAIDIGLNAIGKTCATGGDNILKSLIPSILSVIIMADNDDAGITAAKKLKKELTNKNRNVTIIMPEKGKDLREWVKIVGAENVKKRIGA